MSTANQLTRDESRNSIELEKATAIEKKLDFMGRDPDQPKTPWAVMKYMFDWYPSRMSPAEKKLVRKMDAAILSFGAIAFFLKYLDSSNVNNAYVSGMKEELNLNQNEYAWFGFFYYIGYAALQVPSLMAVSRPGVARWFLPGVELVWGLLTFALISVKKAEHIYVIRFFLGALATPSYTGVNYVLGSWYRGDELFKRSAVFMIGNSLGQMFSGYLQTAAHKTLNGAMGMSGWRWLFIIDGCITVPIALISLCIFPGLPDGRKIWWMTHEEHAMAQERVRSDGVAKSRPFSRKVFIEIFKSWHIWLCVSMITIFLCETYPAGQMTLWLKSVKNEFGQQKYSVDLINTIPTAVFAIIAFTTFVTGSLAGLYNIWAMMAFIQAVCLFAAIVLRVWNVPDNLKWAAYFLLGFMGAPNPLFFGWINRLTKRNAEERAVIMGSVFMVGWAFFAWVPLFAYKTTDAPRWTTGYTTSICCCIVSTSMFMLGGYLHKREEMARVRNGLADTDIDGHTIEDDGASTYENEKEKAPQETQHVEDVGYVSHYTQEERDREAKNKVTPSASAL